LTYLYSAHETSTGFAKIETDHARTTLQRVEQNINVQTAMLTDTIADWAQWNDTFQFINGKNSKYPSINLETSLVNVKLDLFTFWNLDRRLIWGKYLDSEGESLDEQQKPLSSADVQTLKTIDQLHEKLTLEPRISLVALISDIPYLLISVPILPSDLSKAPSNGHLIGGIRLDPKLFKKVGQQLEIDLQMSRTDDSDSAWLSPDIRADLEKNSWSLRLLDSQNLKAYGLINSYQGDPLLTYEVKLPRPIFLQAQRTNATLLVGQLVSTILLVLLMLFTLDRFVLSRLSKLIDSLKDIQQSKDFKMRAPDLGADEIGQLSRALNEGLEQLDQLRANKFQNEKLASLGQMAGGIAHEINNPLAIISASAVLIRKMLQKGIQDSDRYMKQLDDIDRTVTRITKIISGLRNISRDTSQEELVMAPISEAITDAIAICSERFKNHGIELTCDLSQREFQIPIHHLRVQISQVFFNLLSNSFDAIEGMDPAWVRIEAKTDSEHLFIRFTDSGHGISKEVVDKIFQPFFTTKEVGKGTGLGLSLCDSLLKLHNGRLFVDSQSSNTCFVVQLPLRKATS
jgi:signal transduction histidine kinase